MATQPPNNVNVLVRYRADEPDTGISGAKVTVTPVRPSGEAIFLFSDDTGLCPLSLLPGNYRVVADAFGLSSQSQGITVNAQGQVTSSALTPFTIALDFTVEVGSGGQLDANAEITEGRYADVK